MDSSNLAVQQEYNEVIVIDPKRGNRLFATQEGLTDEKNHLVYPLLDGAYRIEKGQNYTDNFGFEWNIFQQTQLDSYSGTNISRKRFFATTRWSRNLEGENILEVGCGAGRFTEVVLKNTKANLFALDYSNAVDANYRNNGPHERLNLYQASMFHMPFAENSFDKIFCFGVLQHTPDFRYALECMAKVLKPGGELVVDFYPIKGWYTKINAKYILRPIFKRISHTRLLKLIRRIVPFWKRIYFFNQRHGLSFFNRFIPISEMPEALKHCLSDREVEEWMLLDTFDMFSPAYDKPQRLKTVRNWFLELDFINVDAEFVQYDREMYAAVVRGTKA
jgi:ubiquinone/menaquinone biosynthesis C-methylase UbiE